MCALLAVHMNVIEIFVRHTDNFNYTRCMYINNILYTMKKIIYSVCATYTLVAKFISISRLTYFATLLS